MAGPRSRPAEGEPRCWHVAEPDDVVVLLCPGLEGVGGAVPVEPGDRSGLTGDQPAPEPAEREAKRGPVVDEEAGGAWGRLASPVGRSGRSATVQNTSTAPASARPRITFSIRIRYPLVAGHGYSSVMQRMRSGLEAMGSCTLGR